MKRLYPCFDAQSFDHLIKTSEPLFLKNLHPSEINGHVLIAETVNRTPHLETSLEIAIRLAVSGYSVIYFHYGNSLLADDFYHKVSQNLFSWFKRAGISYEQHAIKLADRLRRDFHLPIEFIQASKVFRNQHLPRLIIDGGFEGNCPDNLPALKKLSWRRSNQLGISVASSLISNLRSVNFDFKAQIPRVRHLISDYQKSYLLVNALVGQLGGIGALVVFNGRFPSSKAVCQLASDLRLPVYYHERGCSSEKFSLRDYQPHDRVNMQDHILSCWNLAFASRDSIAAQYYQNLRNGVSIAWLNYSPGEAGLDCSSLVRRARSISRKSKVVCFFTSSEDEYESVDDVFTSSDSDWKTQREALQAVADACFEASVSLVVRVHPRLAKIKSPDLKVWDELSFLSSSRSHVFVVKSASSISSYSLIDQVDAVITGRSTMGIESVYWGKPSITLSDSFYDEIGASICKCRTKQDLKVTINDVENMSVSPDSALPYAYFQATHGESYSLYVPTDLFSGKFLGVNLSDGFLTPWGRLLRFLVRRTQFLLNQ